MHSSMRKPWAMLQSGQALLHTYPLVTTFILSHDIILCRNVGPRWMIASTIWTNRWTVMFKNVGGKYISSSHRITTISSCSFENSVHLIDFWETVLKKLQRYVSVLTDVLVHYPSNCNQNYLHHHHTKFMRHHPNEILFLRVYVFFYQPWVTKRHLHS
jgi:hypothetical protein